MGYYTRYTLKCKQNLIEMFRKECFGAEYAFDDNGEPNDETRWYDHTEDLKAFSKKHPKELFMLSGEGEESEDIWKLYVKNGKSQHCKARLEFDDYDESKLE